MVRVKICGITNEKDALSIAKLGVDALGFVITEGKFPNKISVEDAKKIVAKLPPFVSSVISSNLDLDNFVEICKTIRPDAVEIHSDMCIKDLKLIRKRLEGVKLIRTVFVKDESAIKVAKSINDYVDAITLDNPQGISGVLDWDICSEIVKQCSKPVILAGGLNPNNIREAILKVKPYAVDVISGVEKEQGKMDLGKVEKFVRIAKSVNLPRV